MTADDLTTPLGQKPAGRPRIPLHYVPHALAAGLALFLILFAGWALVVNDPLGGEPMVRTAIEQGAATKPAEKPAAPPQAASPKPAEASPGSKTVTIIDGSSGRRQEVTVHEPQTPGRVDQASRLVETTRHGPIPKIAEDGARPADVYAKPAKATPKPLPRIAIIVAGLGVSVVRTTDALDKLPASVTLAFMPYAKDLDPWIARANQLGHELVLQAPMEPFDYPDNDPGPQTLLTTLAAEQNVDRLHWFMSRFQGYVGVMNHAGSRFTATEQAFSPILREIGRRGLIYFDDGSSPRSVANQIAGANNLAFARADVAIDAAPTSADIDAALSRLETLARDRGYAVGVAQALPLTNERIAQWTKLMEERGVSLVPLSAVASKPKSS